MRKLRLRGDSNVSKVTASKCILAPPPKLLAMPPSCLPPKCHQLTSWCSDPININYLCNSKAEFCYRKDETTLNSFHMLNMLADCYITCRQISLRWNWVFLVEPNIDKWICFSWLLSFSAHFFSFIENWLWLLRWIPFQSFTGLEMFKVPLWLKRPGVDRIYDKQQLERLTKLSLNTGYIKSSGWGGLLLRSWRTCYCTHTVQPAHKSTKNSHQLSAYFARFLGWAFFMDNILLTVL